MIEKSYADKNMSMICAGLDNERPTIPYNARKAVVRVRKIRPEKRWQSVKIWKRRFRLNIPPQTGQQNGGNRSRVTVEMSPGVRLQVQAVE